MIRRQGYLFIFKKARAKPPIKKKKSKGAQDVLDRLNAYLNAEDTKPVLWLVSFWKNQQKAITYAELRDAVLSGQLSDNTLREWRIAYSHLVSTKMKPMWEDSMRAANTSLAACGFYFDPTTTGVRNWIDTHGSEWVTKIGDQQREAINAMLGKAYSGDWTVDELARAIRPTIGLNAPQAEANLRYYKHVKANLLVNNPTMREASAEKRAREAAAKYAGKQHQYRAHTIATTEMAFAYNKGADEGIRQAQAKGYMGKVMRVWSTAADEGVCHICAALDGVAIDMDEEFDFKGSSLYGGQKQTPPAHPRCRCACAYKEVEPPSIENIKLDYDEEYAMKNYISSESYKINAKLRDDAPLTPADYTFTINLDSALSKMPRYEGTLTRSLAFISPEDMAAFLRQHEKGSIIEYTQYISTTKGSIYNPDAPIQIIILYATAGRDISGYNFAEKEVLYERGSRFFIADIIKDDKGTINIIMEEN